MKVPRQLLIRTKSKSPSPPTSSTAPGRTTASTAAATHSQSQAPTANTTLPTKKEKTVKEKRLLSSPLSNHKSPTFSNDQNNTTPTPKTKIPRMHRDMRLLCDEFRISDQSRLALRKYDATRLEDFCYMTDEDYTNMMDMQERMGCPIPPLQQRKIRVLLLWARSITDGTQATTTTAVLGEEGAKTVGDRTAATFTSHGTTAISSLTKPGGMEGGSTVPPTPLPPHRTASAASGIIVPSDWEKRFYADLPSLKEELKKMGGEPQLPSWLSSLRIFCGFA